MWMSHSILSLSLATALVLTTVTASAGAEPGPDRIADHFAASFRHEAAGEYEAALNDVLAVLRLDDAHYVATLRAGWLYYLQLRHDDATRMYTRASVLAPDALEPRLGQMLPLMAAGRWTDAERLGQELLRLAPRDYTVRSRLAWIAWSQARYPTAESRYREVLADYPSDVEMRLGLGWSLARQGKKDEATRAFNDVLLVYKDHVRAREGLQSL